MKGIRSYSETELEGTLQKMANERGKLPIPAAIEMLRPVAITGHDVLERFPLFLECISKTGSHTDACKQSGLSRLDINHIISQHDYARELYNSAMDDAFELVEREAYRRGVEGYPEDILYRGEKIGEKISYSDQMLANLLKGYRKKDYGTTKAESAINNDYNDDTNSVKDELAKRLGVSNEDKAEADDE